MSHLYPRILGNGKFINSYQTDISSHEVSNGKMEDTNVNLNENTRTRSAPLHQLLKNLNVKMENVLVCSNPKYLR